jgi:hypothetical protein
MHEIHDDPMRHYPSLIQMLAWHLAVKLVKQEHHARAYLRTHRAELIEAAIRRVRADPEFLKLGESEAKRRGRMWPLEPKSKPTKPPIVDYPSLEERLATTWQNLIDKNQTETVQ